MARTRSVRISESLDEIDQLRSYYRGKPEAVRLTFLRALSEDRSCTIGSAADHVGISARRGRYWWDAYRGGGLQKLLDRRVWRKSELKEVAGDQDRTKVRGDSDSQTSSLPWMRFLTAIAMNSSEYSDVTAWIVGFREALIEFLGDVDLIVMNVRHGIDVLTPQEGKIHVHREVTNESAVLGHEMSSVHEERNTWEQIIEQGKRSNFPFEKYHYPPTGFDYFLETGKRARKTSDENDSYIGSILLFREKHNDNISRDTINLLERLRPFMVYVMTDFVVRSSLASGASGNIEGMVDKVAGDASLTPQETKVLLLGFLGNSYQEIGNELHVSVHTVQSHVRSIYRKTGASKLGEIYSRFFTAQKFPDAEVDDSIE